jgi:hypothetical protein
MLNGAVELHSPPRKVPKVKEVGGEKEIELGRGS